MSVVLTKIKESFPRPFANLQVSFLLGEKMTDYETEKDLIDEAEHRATENPTVGIEQGYEVHIAIRRVPEDAKIPDDWAVNLYIPQEGDDNIPIARVDTAHEGCHIDRLYLPKGHEQRREDYGFNADSPEGAVKYMTDNERWREWVRRYDRNHGLP